MYAADITDLLEGLRQRTRKCSTFHQFEFPSNIDNRLCERTTGLTSDQFNEVHDHLKTMKNSKARTTSQALAIYLFWLKTGLSQDTIAAYFGNNDLKQQNISNYSKEVRTALSQSFVSINLGAKAQTRDQLCERNTPFVREFLNNHDDQKMAVIADGTYLRIEKSSNNAEQRKCYSDQKKAPIIKPFVICAPDGYIIDIYGLYPGTMNDAEIIKIIMKTDQDLQLLLKEGDILVVDRGFRDALSFLKNKYKLETMMPRLLNKNQKQFTTEEANESRLCTKIRYVVESAIGLVIGRYRVFDQRAENKSLTHYLEDIRIAGALVNKYCKRMYSDKGHALVMARTMFEIRKKENKLKDLVEQNNLHRKSLFIDIHNNDLEFECFPKLSIETIQTEIAYGSYQLSHSLSYLAEHFNQNGSYLIFSCKQPITDDGSKIISTKIQSRHSNLKKYRVFIHYMPLICSTTEHPDLIKGWYCECKSGARTVGCCCHVAALLYFLCYARHIKHQSLLKPASFLSSIFPKHVSLLENCSDDSEKSDELLEKPKKKKEKKKNRSRNRVKLRK
jgi:hypothetical protein